MATDYVPVTPVSGIYSSVELGENFDRIQVALSRLLNLYGDTGTGQNALQADVDLNSRRVYNAASPQDPQDLMTKAYGDAKFGGASVELAAASAAAALLSETSAAASALAADLSAQAALASAWDAAASAIAADDSATAAAGSEALADRWATEAEDVEVVGGEFSAYHWAKKAEAVSGATTAAVTPADTSPGTLASKIAVGEGLTVSVTNAGSDEALLIEPAVNIVTQYVSAGLGKYTRVFGTASVTPIGTAITPVLAPAGANAKVLRIHLLLRVEAGNVANSERFIQVRTFNDTLGTAGLRIYSLMAFEQVAIADGTGLAYTTVELDAPVVAGAARLQIYATDASGNASATASVAGYS